jgi:hypothetical protein
MVSIAIVASSEDVSRGIMIHKGNGPEAGCILSAGLTLRGEAGEQDGRIVFDGTPVH